MPKKKKTSKKTKAIAITKIPKGNVKGLKSGYALVFGSKSKPRFGTKRFKTVSGANKYARKKGMI